MVPNHRELRLPAAYSDVPDRDLVRTDWSFPFRVVRRKAYEGAVIASAARSESEDHRVRSPESTPDGHL